MKQIKGIGLILVIAAAVTAFCNWDGTKGSSHYREKHGLINEFDRDYAIQSIRVDDDAEYHIIAVSSTGDVKTLSDAEVPYDLVVRFGHYASPIMRIHFSDRKFGEGEYYPEGLPSIMLPFGYKIETFDD